MNIGFFGDKLWATNSLKIFLREKKIKIKFVCLRFKNPDLELAKLAKKNKIKVIRIKNINNHKFLEFLKSQHLDLLVSMSFNQIFKKEILSYYKNKIINCHASLLPHYRGRSPLNWVLINDEKHFGITVHFVNKFIDRGDIILQKKFKIKDSDDYKSLLMKSYLNCPKILGEAIKLFINNKIKPIKQNNLDSKGTYFGKRKKGDEFINWKQNSRKIYCFIRALTFPSILATTRYKNKKILIENSIICKKKLDKNIKPGKVLKVTKNFFIVKTIDSAIKVTKWRGKIKENIILY